MHFHVPGSRMNKCMEIVLGFRGVCLRGEEPELFLQSKNDMTSYATKLTGEEGDGR